MRRFEFLKNNKGSASVFVLSAIIVLTALGAIVLTASLANIKTGARYRDWSAMFYQLDTEGEEHLKTLDSLLEQAESSAREYMGKGYYNIDPDDASSPDTGLNDEAQRFFYGNRWQYTLDDYLSPEDYMNDYAIHISGFMERLYFYYASRLLEETALAPAITITGTGKFTNFMANPGWDDYKPANGDIKAEIELRGDDTGNERNILVKMDIIVPSYETVIQTTYTPYKGNPVWANAVTAKGGVIISASANANIYGDVYASGLNASGNPLGMDAGLKVMGTASIFGNVYSRGDVYIAGNNGSLNIKRYNEAGFTINRDFKNKIFYNLFHFDINDVATGEGINIYNYTENESANIPFIYNDGITGGNVYCNDLTIARNVRNAAINISGNLMTTDDIEMNGLYSSIVVGGNFTGINSEEAGGDPNASSSIINNYPYEADGTEISSIQIGGGVIIPGTSFYEFDSNTYYQSGESLSSKDQDIFNAYVYASGLPGGYSLYYLDGNRYYIRVFSPAAPGNELNEKIQGLIAFLTGRNIKTNINAGGDVKGYSLGTVLIHENGESEEPASIYSPEGGAGTFLPDWNSNRQDYLTLGVDALKEIFLYKTSQLGTSESGFSNFENRVGPYSDGLSAAGVAYLDGDSTYTVNGDESKIIYCTGNLTISGDGNIRGSVISRGSVTISGNAGIYYDEAVIENILMKPAARDFFEPGTRGKDIIHVKDYRTDSGTRSFVKRYNITQWNEYQ